MTPQPCGQLHLKKWEQNPVNKKLFTCLQRLVSPSFSSRRGQGEVPSLTYKNPYPLYFKYLYLHLSNFTINLHA